MPFFGVPIRNGLPIGLGSVAGFGVQQFDPSQLFEGGTVAGAWYDPSDLGTMFDTSAGTTLVAMPGLGSAVSVGLMLDKSQGLVLGSELKGTGAISTIGAPPTLATYNTTTGVGTAQRQNSTNSSGVFIAASANTLYRIEIEKTGGAGTLQIRQNSVTGTTIIAAITTRATYNLVATSGSGFYIACSTNGAQADFVIHYVAQVLGNHAIAFNNTTARPELRARVNLLVATATLSTQSVTTQATSYTLSFAGTGSITLSGTATGSYNAGTHTITCTAGTLTLTVSGTVTTADLRPANSGALLPAYQAVVDANTYDTSGFPLYLFFDGIDDSMYTPANLDLSGTDKVSVFAGVRKLSDAANGAIGELSAAYASNTGAFLLRTGSSTTTVGYLFASRGTINPGAYANVTTPISPVTNVATGIGDIAGDSQILRLNGVQVASNATDQGTGNFGTYPLFIGARNNASLFLNGNIYSLIVVGSAVSAGNISATEQWVAGKTGIQI